MTAGRGHLAVPPRRACWRAGERCALAPCSETLWVTIGAPRASDVLACHRSGHRATPWLPPRSHAPLDKRGAGWYYPHRIPGFR